MVEEDGELVLEVIVALQQLPHLGLQLGKEEPPKQGGWVGG